MIIFGFSVFYFLGLIGTGQFACPNCGGDRDYKHKTARRFFTLFFVPVIPLDKVGEVVQCQACHTKYDPAVLRRPTNTQLGGAMAAAMRAAASVVVRAGGNSDTAIRAAIEAVRGTGFPAYDIEQLQADLGQPVEAAAEPLRTLSTLVTTEACERYLAQAVRIALVDGGLSPAERDALGWVASNLGMTPAHAHGVISTIERSVTSG